MTARLFLDDSAARGMSARVVAVDGDAVVLDRTVFYARSGGQPGDSGTLRWDGGEAVVTEALKGEGEAIRHVLAQSGAAGPMPAAGTMVEGTLDWARRFAHMRMHTALHLLCAALPGASVTGGQIGAEKSRLDFDLPDPPTREAVQALLAALVDADHAIAAEWVDEAVLDSNPGLVRTLSVQPPRGTGRLRLVRIGTAAPPIDLQPCGGTHVATTGAVGLVRVLKIENKGRQNRRISLALEAP